MNDACYPTADAYFKDLLIQYPKGSLHYNRYLLGEWTGAEGMVFSSFDESKNVLKSSESIIHYSNFDRFIIGIDYGSSHPTAIELIGVKGDAYFVVESYEYKSTDINVILNKIYEIIDDVIEKGNYVKAIYNDYGGGGKALEDTANSSVRSLFANPDKQNTSASIAHINSLFYQQKLYIMDNCKSLISNINSYIYKKNTVKDEVVKLNDDHCDAMRYAVYTDSQLHP
jgi:PBSX family phage terminase large subunit